MENRQILRLVALWLLTGMVTTQALAKDDAEFDLDHWLTPAPQTSASPAPTATPAARSASIQLPAATMPAASQRPRPQLEEIIVTAQKRSASLQDTPISMAALNSAALEAAGIDGLDDIGANVPSLQIEPFPTNNATLRLYIRGIGIIDAQITQDPAVAIYLDGVYIARSTGTALDLADLERIEVLRGPQGTLYGRNTTGGAVNLISRRPDPEALHFDQRFSVGNFGLFKSRSVLNLPLADELAVKLAFLDARKRGFVDNTGPGGDFGDRRQQGARFDLRYQGWDWAMLDYSFDFYDATQWNYLYQAVLTPESDKGPTEQIKREAQANTVYSTRMLRALATGVPLEPSSTRIHGHALTLAGQALGLDWKYILAYRDLKDGTYTDLGGGAGSTRFRVDTGAYDGPAALLANGGQLPAEINVLTQQQWSHELQLSADLLDDGRLSTIGGLFWFSEKGIDDWPLHHQFSGALSPSATADVTGTVFGAAGPRLVNIVDIRNTINNQAWAAFGQLSWTPDMWSQRLRLSFGYRHSQDSRAATKTKITTNYLEVQQQGQGVALPITSPLDPPANPLTDLLFGNVSLLNVEQFDNVPAARRDSDDSISFIAEWQLNDAANLYGKYVEAYKGGGFNIRDPQADGTTRPAADGEIYGFGFSQGFAPEYVRSLELGLKTEFGGRLRLNTDVFYSLYDDMQINFLIPGTISDTKVANAGEARMWGFELDGQWAATRGLNLAASYAYLNAEVTRVISQANGEDVTDQFQFSSAPEHSLSLSGDWTLAQGHWGQARLHAAYNYVSERLGGATPGKPVGLPAYDLLNLRLSASELRIGGIDGLGVALWAKNLLDEEYEINAIDNLPQADRAVIWGEPLSYGLDLSYRF